MSRQVSCSRWQESITAWVDREFQDTETLGDLERHLEVCEQCRLYAEAEAATKDVVAAGYSVPIDVGRLRARVAGQLDALGRPARAARRFPPARLAWAAAVPLVLIAVVVGALMLRPSPPLEAAPLLKAAVTDHVECMLGRLLLDLKTTDRDAVRRWLEQRLARPVALPALASKSELSTRVARLGSVESPQIFFDRDGQMLSLFVMPAAEVPRVPGRRIERAGREFFVNQIEEYTVVFWHQADLLYCLVGKGEEEVLGLAAEYAGSASG